ncbi:response regulator transcription factor [Yoonia sediminilitoris]|uniref:DNA-binding response OmpR family regulator n=1 Tax=Yoonia sediminilitoris TaxID=1286148 RepID=A0A2T6KHE2_9RHOB|nr:response regulator transcription factor [Yoonia sediminilitoris]PUB14934.1 DNA-binding response OmpR family regulator [Yoonia sediminilitoris]RCW95650.1 DNA-binding response OmpR family regulator [Yoonia sediminilitoris]
MTQTAILIVDDDPEITSALARGLQMHGYDTATESTAEGAERRFADPMIAAAIIDVMIGQDSGIDLVKRLRGAGHHKPILMLSALSEVDDRTAGLQAGADDYVVKPFAFDELVARLKVQLQRAAKSISQPCQLDPVSRTVQGPTQTAQLTEREFDLLAMLHEKAGTPISRGEIFDQLWANEGTSSENVVDVYIGYLRKKLDPAEDFRMTIKTIRNRGFVLEYLP